jgi:hypothetical protein
MIEAMLFRRCRKALGLSQSAIARALLIASDRTVRRCAQRRRRREMSRRRGLIACRNCGTTFLPKRNDAGYCSPACRQKAYRGRMKATAP